MKPLTIIIRWLLAAGSVDGGVLMMEHATHEENAALQIVYAMISLGLWGGSIALVIPETAVPFAHFIGECFGNLVFPDARFHKPGLSYILADFYQKEERIPEAIQEYLKIIRYYPEERRAYLEVISLAERIGASSLSKKYLRRFRRRFKIKQSVKKMRGKPRWI